MDDDNWDLQAVVRGCAAVLSSTSTPSTTTITTTKPSCSSSFQQPPPPPPFFQLQPQQTNQDFCGFSDLFEPKKNEYYLLNDVYNPLMFSSSSSSSSPTNNKSEKKKTPFFSSSPSPSIHDQCFPISPLSVLGGLQDLAAQQQQEQKLVQGKQQAFGVIRSTTTHAQSTRLKKRKNQMKRVCHVPAEGLSSDMWSWRKYGQKPIKGSPYPRGYYRCSTSKGCSARKQVERNRTDPGMFIVTYTGEHNHPIPTHRNSLAGSTRQKPISPADDKPTSSPPVSPSSASLSPGKTEEKEREEMMIEDDEDDDEMGVDDDFFDGLDELVPPVTGDCLSDHFPASLTFPWLSSTTTTTTAAGGS